MPRWKALPDELDPEVREFAGQLRRLVDRSGLSIAAVSDRTGYSKTSWERYLNGRLLAPKGAIVALAEVTGTPPVHLITMWELAERAWSRSEMRHDMTMQAIRISQARAALDELGADPAAKADGKGASGKAPKPGKLDARRDAKPDAGTDAKADRKTPGRTTPGQATPGQTTPGQQAPGRTAPGGHAPGAQASGAQAPDRTAPGGHAPGRKVPENAPSPWPSPPSQPSHSPFPGQPSARPPAPGGRGTARNGSGGGVGPVTGVAGPAGVSPTVGPPSVGSHGASSSYGEASASAFGAAGSPGGPGGPGGAGGPGGPGPAGSPDRQRRRRKLTMFLAGVVGALVVIAAAVFMTGFGGDDKGDDRAKPSVTPTKKDTDLPAGVECSGKDCAGKDPENMGCGGELAKTTSRATIGKTLVEVRYSKTCGAAWARITQATPGDELTITGSGGGAGAKQKSTVNEDFDAYTPMVAAESGTAAKACATLTSGRTGCTA
ncbi:DUF2690 domain-containing protein [Streptomyces sp. PA5.6]|uniref:helix-turn-helix domain-containing protein n=1 Tax=Streptomyces sp. PA5.6 TaxID=3035651 RepID=UPI003904967D